MTYWYFVGTVVGIIGLVLWFLAPVKASSPHHYFKSSECEHWGPVQEIILGSESDGLFGRSRPNMKFMGQRCEDE